MKMGISRKRESHNKLETRNKTRISKRVKKLYTKAFQTTERLFRYICFNQSKRI